MKFPEGKMSHRQHFLRLLTFQRQPPFAFVFPAREKFIELLGKTRKRRLDFHGKILDTLNTETKLPMVETKELYKSFYQVPTTVRQGLAL